MFYNSNESFADDTQKRSPYSYYYTENKEFSNHMKNTQSKTSIDKPYYMNHKMSNISEDKPRFYKNIFLFENSFFNSTTERNKYILGNMKENCKVEYYADVKDQIDNSGGRSFNTIINSYNSEYKKDYFRKFLYLTKEKEIDILPNKFKNKIEKVKCFELFFTMFYSVCFINNIPKLVSQSPHIVANLVPWVFGYISTHYVIYFIKQHYYKASFKMLFQDQSERNILFMLDYYEKQ